MFSVLQVHCLQHKRAQSYWSPSCQQSCRLWLDIVHRTGPSRATAGPGKLLLRDPVTTLFRRRRDWEGGNVGRGVPSLSDQESGGASWAPRAGSAKSWFYAHLWSERSHLEHPFQYFWAMAGPHKRRGALENFPPFPAPSRHAWQKQCSFSMWDVNRQMAYSQCRTNWAIYCSPGLHFSKQGIINLRFGERVIPNSCAVVH